MKINHGIWIELPVTIARSIRITTPTMRYKQPLPNVSKRYLLSIGANKDEGDRMIIGFRTLGLALCLCLISEFEFYPIPQPSAYAERQLEYAKWGHIAMQLTSKRYQGEIIDYLHVGRTQISSGIAEETFKFWLRKRDREFGVWVTIRFYTLNDQIITVKFKESTN
jgi:hypothetical protein